VTNKPRYSTVLVYDVSRWGRFQNADASAYYDYHCRLHGVKVVYVAEAFGIEVTPMSTLLKSMKRVMAAEYSRDLATKSRAGQDRVVAMGYQIGPLPALGFRRCSVSADGKSRQVLARGQRKIALTDRVEWILGPDSELGLVRRICQEYATGRSCFKDLESMATREHWVDHQGNRLTRHSIARLVRNEALVGNFVWGRRGHAGRILQSEPSRATGSVPRIIDDETWTRMQTRLATEPAIKSDELLLDELRQAFARKPDLVTRDLLAEGCSHPRTYRSRFGSWPNIVKAAGRDSSALATEVAMRARARHAQTREFGKVLANALRAENFLPAYDGRLNMLTLDGHQMHVRLVWQTREEQPDQPWRHHTARRTSLSCRPGNWTRSSLVGCPQRCHEIFSDSGAHRQGP
jgi:hypothetical protein